MERLRSLIQVVGKGLTTYLAIAGGLWVIFQAMAFFRPGELTSLLGKYWLIIFVGVPLGIALVRVAHALYQHKEVTNQMTDVELKKLLKSDQFADHDLRHILVPNLGYSDAELAGPNATKAALANRLVEQCVADGKRAQLIKEMRSLKPHFVMPPDA